MMSYDQLSNNMRPYSVNASAQAYAKRGITVKNDSSTPILLTVDIKGEATFAIVLDPRDGVQVPITGLNHIVGMRYGDLAGFMAQPITIQGNGLKNDSTIVFRSTKLFTLTHEVVDVATARVLPAICYTPIEIAKMIVTCVLFLYVAFWFSGKFGMLLKIASIVFTLRQVLAARSEPDPSDAFPRVVSARDRVFRSNAMSPRHVLRLPQNATYRDLDGSLLFHLAQWNPNQFDDAKMKKYAYRVCEALTQAYKVLGGRMDIDVTLLDQSKVKLLAHQFAFIQDAPVHIPIYARNMKGNRIDATRRNRKLRLCLTELKTLANTMHALCDQMGDIA